LFLPRGSANDILVLHDVIAMEGHDKYNHYFRVNPGTQTRGRRASLEWVEAERRASSASPSSARMVNTA
jgi:hypothetical protein